MKKIAIIGCGFLGGIIADALRRGLLEDYELAAAMSRKKEDAESLVSGLNARAVDSLEELLAEKPDFVIETASVAIVREACIPVLSSGASFIPLSIGAFADRELYNKAIEVAAANGCKLYIPHGAVGGFDVLQTAYLMAEAQGKEINAGISTRKGSASLRGSSVYRENMENEESLAFSGSCSEAIALLPTKVNVAVAQSLCTVGPERAGAEIHSIPGYVGDEHTITAELDGIRVKTQVYSAESSIAAWSIVSLLKNLSSAVSFF